MKVYWNNKNIKAKIIEAIEKESARPWGSTEPKSHVLIGSGKVFIYPPDYHIDGYSLSTQDLKDLLAKLSDQSNLLICDGCAVQSPFEHRCHGNMAFEHGEPTGKSCQCPDCSESFPF